MNEKPSYGNWVPEKALYALFAGAAVLLALTAVFAGRIVWLAIVFGIGGAALLIEAIYMLACHEVFAFGKGNMMAKVHEHLVKKLPWDGSGTLLDIGCGAGADHPLRQSVPGREDHRHRLLGRGMELRKVAVREKRAA